MNDHVSRRDLLLGALRRRRAPASGGQRIAPVPAPAPAETTDEPRTAVIMGRQCLAYRHVTCATCFERCPHPGAIVRERGIPRVVPDQCVGCGVCHDVCPAPVNAILMVRAKPAGATP